MLGTFYEKWCITVNRSKRIVHQKQRENLFAKKVFSSNVARNVQLSSCDFKSSIKRAVKP